MNRKPDCIFCQIVHKQAPAHVVCEDDRTLVFMDIFPVADGHTLIIPKAHCDDLFGADPDDLRAVIDRSREVAHAIGRVLSPDGLGVFQLNGAAAGLSLAVSVVLSPVLLAALGLERFTTDGGFEMSSPRCRR